MRKFIKRYFIAMISLIFFVSFSIIFVSYRDKAMATMVFQIRTMVLVIPPIFILLGLMDVWVPREKMIKYMGPESGFVGGLLAFLLGSFAAGPLYGAFPVAAMLMKKGAGIKNILIFIGAWSTTKIPMLLFEISALGLRFAMARLFIDIIGIVIIALAIKAVLPAKEIDRMYEAAKNID